MNNTHPAVSVFRNARPGLTAAALFSFFVNLGALVSPIYMQQIFDRVMQSRHLETLAYMTLIVFALLAVFAMLDAIRGSILAKVSRWWDEVVHADLLAAVIRGSATARVNNASAFQDLMAIRQFVGGNGILPFFDGPWMPLFLLAITLIHPWLGAVACGSAVLLFLLALINDFMTRKRMDGLGNRQKRAQDTVDVATRHAESVFSMGMLPGVLKRFAGDNEHVSRTMYEVASITAYIGALSKFIRFSAQISVLGLGAYLATQAEITSGSMIAASIILSRALAPAEQAIGAWRGFVAARNAHKRILEIFRRIPPEQEQTVQPDMAGNVRLEDIMFSIPGQERALLRGVNADFEKGQVVALVGPSGTGKSTLCKLLIGAFTPNVGSVRLDGVKISNWNRKQLAASIGYLPQNVELLDGTIKDNICRLGEPDDNAAVKAAQLAGCHDMINRLPQGYDTLIGEGGVHLSGGQAQRIGFARAIYGMPKLIVLDEPNSNLDSEGDQAFQLGIRSLKAHGCTVFIVSHKTSALTSVDRIITLRDGVIVKDQSREAYMRDVMKPVGKLLEQVKSKTGQNPTATQAENPAQRAANNSG